MHIPMVLGFFHLNHDYNGDALVVDRCIHQHEVPPRWGMGKTNPLSNISQ
jgi:hypothetical protein